MIYLLLALNIASIIICHHIANALGAYYRRMRSRHGAPKAINATAHKLVRLIYSMLKHGTAYGDQG